MPQALQTLGYGAAEDFGNKDPSDMVKESISDAIKVAAMRFGVALDIWSKEDLDAGGEPITSSPQLSAQEAADIRDKCINLTRNQDKDALLAQYKLVDASKGLKVGVTNENGDPEMLGGLIKRLGLSLSKSN